MSGKSKEPRTGKEARPNIQVRVNTPFDMAAILEIHNESSSEEWGNSSCKAFLSTNNALVLVAEYERRVAGFVFYNIFSGKTEIFKIAVFNSVRRKGIGTELIHAVLNLKSVQKTTLVCIEVRETDLDTQLFLQKSGFRCTRIFRDQFPSPYGDAYRMEYRI